MTIGLLFEGGAGQHPVLGHSVRSSYTYIRTYQVPIKKVHDPVIGYRQSTWTDLQVEGCTTWLAQLASRYCYHHFTGREKALFISALVTMSRWWFCASDGQVTLIGKDGQPARSRSGYLLGAITNVSAMDGDDKKVLVGMPSLVIV